MKTIKLTFYLLSIMLLGLSYTGCIKDQCEQTQRLYVWNPVYKDVDAIRQEFVIESPKTMENPGKIYFYNNFVFVSEIKEGIHVIDNADPSNPQPINFIKIPGNKDMAVKNGRLYADNYIDLLSIDISDPRNPTLASRTENVFKDYELHADFGYLIRYERTLETREVDCEDPIYYTGWGFCPNCEYSTLAASPILANADFSGAPRGAAFNASVPASSVGIGGSFARFTIAKDHLYTVDEYDLSTFNLVDCDNPGYISTTNIGWGIETIFPLGDHLFIGSNTGMFIYSISNADLPVQLSQFQHARACDPVFVSDNKAYVTLRDGSECEGFVNQLDVVDVTNLNSPQLITSHNMQHPHGLSIRGNDLFICEGEFGISIFDRSDDFTISSNLLNKIEGFHAYDIIIPSANLAMIIGQDGLYQFDITDPENITELSQISLNR